jgi:TetR/AcrR family transcriptional regulator, lmrAB and yxaGH operons repressor
MSEQKLSSRDKIIRTTSRLLQQQGYHATGLNQITKESGAPKGSLYYYFPKGKEELACEAVRSTADNVAARLRGKLEESEDAVTAIQGLILELAEHFELDRHGQESQGVPVAAVALETSLTNETLRAACHAAYEQWEQIFAGKLRQNGFPEQQAEELSIVLNAMLEGAFVLSFTRRNSVALIQMAKRIPLLLAEPLQIPH